MFKFWYCYAVLCVISVFAIILLQKGEQVALLFSNGLLAVIWLVLFCAGWSAVCDCGINWP